jgi:hypothetical protein
MVTPMGKTIRALEEGPSTIPSSPVPTQVEAVPCGVTSRRRWFHESATRMVPLAVNAMPIGCENMALAPSANP